MIQQGPGKRRKEKLPLRPDLKERTPPPLPEIGQPWYVRLRELLRQLFSTARDVARTVAFLEAYWPVILGLVAFILLTFIAARLM